MAGGRIRNFSLSTYLSEIQIKSVLEEHKLNIKNYAYILHDKDTKPSETDGAPILVEPHFHLIIITYNATTVSAVRRWFTGFEDDTGTPINTFCESCSDIYAMYDYLWHKGLTDKYSYDADDIVCLDRSQFLGSNTGDVDNAYLMFMDMCNGVNFNLMAKKYGRDFIFHYTTLKILVYDFLREKEVYGDFEQLERKTRTVPLDYIG